MVFTCSITSTLDIFPNTHTHTCAIGPLIPQTSTPVIDTLTTCARIGAKNMCVFAAGDDRLSCPPSPTVWLQQTCVQACGSVSVFFWGDLIMSNERSRVSAVKWPASTVHWAVSHCSTLPRAFYSHARTRMSTHVPARADILAFRLVLRQHITHTSTRPLPSPLSAGVDGAEAAPIGSAG